ncbi:Poly(A) polymerase [Tothia fuscella]|uniref:Poly(A) polymerase n=1 Tax=Tothia fuscella TaxID=1048955 RepID=A0A9P4TZD4_9PEZI|nr:Poly(A) polymerase [Tothia fuscella]
MATSEQKWGLTNPISVDLPTQDDVKQNEALIAELKSQNNFESAEATEHRVQILELFQQITEEFVKDIGRRKHLAPSVINGSGGKVSTFGSYRLGVFGPGSDIDTLIVAPKHVSRDDFFEVFPEILARMSKAGDIQEITPVPEAHVPILKLEYAGISIDLIFVTLQLSNVPLNLDLKDNSLLRGLSEVDLRSVNGVRVTDEILELVPQVKSFRQALRAVKLWAQQRAIYSNITGFPGGVAWAMMVARVCQLYPFATGAVLVSKFFNIMESWRWPQPVQLKGYEKGPLEVREWNPKVYPPDRKHIMPVITPAFPSMCATNNINHSTKSVIQKEMVRAKALTNDIFTKKVSWKKLFEKHTFFTEGYKYYLSVISGSKSKDGQQMWGGLVQSKLRHLVSGIADWDTGVDLAHPYVKGFERVHRCATEEDVDAVLHGSMKFVVGSETVEGQESAKHKAAVAGVVDVQPPDESRKVEEGVITMWTTTYYVGLELAASPVAATKKLDISQPVSQFREQCYTWTAYDPSMNSLCTVHVRSYDLPEDVFGPGEKRPVKTKKTKTPKGGKSSSTPAQAAAGSQPSPSTNSPMPTSTSVSSKKRTLESEVRPIAIGEDAMQRPLADTRCDPFEATSRSSKGRKQPTIPHKLLVFLEC